MTRLFSYSIRTAAALLNAVRLRLPAHYCPSLQPQIVRSYQNRYRTEGHSAVNQDNDLSS